MARKIVTHVKQQAGKSVEQLHSDNGKEYRSNEVNEYFKQQEIMFRKKRPYTLHNEIAERTKRFLMENGRSMRYSTDVPSRF